MVWMCSAMTRISECAFTQGSVKANSFPGGNSALEPPDPIPNSEVKRRSADGSTRLSSCESMSPPGLEYQTPVRQLTGVFFVCRKHNVSEQPLSAGGIHRTVWMCLMHIVCIVLSAHTGACATVRPRAAWQKPAAREEFP